MATNATNPTPGRTARIIHWLIPSRRQVAIGLAADVALLTLGLPLWIHLAAAVVIHLALHALGRFL